jgi:hypothetical protein
MAEADLKVRLYGSEAGRKVRHYGSKAGQKVRLYMQTKLAASSKQPDPLLVGTFGDAHSGRGRVGFPVGPRAAGML